MRIAIVELGDSHDECIYAQLLFLLDKGYEVNGYFNPIIVKQVSDFSNLFNQIKSFNFDNLSLTKKLKQTYKLYLVLKSYDKVIFNTIRSSIIRNLMILLKFHIKVECIGVIHNTKKLKNSFTQAIINIKIKKYFVLADHLVNDEIKTLKINSFYPIFFSKQKYINLKNDLNQNWICIAGRVEFKRRNYRGLLDYLKSSKINDNIRFLILGNINTYDGPELKEEILKLKLEKYFIFFYSFISNQDYFNYLNSSNYVLLLLHKDQNYLNSKIAGSYNLAYGFKKPILYREFYNSIEDFNENGIAYNENNLIYTINNLPSRFDKKIYKHKKWDYNFQQKKYINFINS